MVKLPYELLAFSPVQGFSMEHHERVNINAPPHSEACMEHHERVSINATPHSEAWSIVSSYIGIW